MAYTWAEFTAYLRHARVRELRRRREAILDANLAANGGDKANEHLKALDEAIAKAEG
jgi:hypothetical protein